MSKLGRGTLHWTALARVVACDPHGSKLSRGCKFIPVPYISYLPTHLLGTGLKAWNRDLTNSLRLEILFRGKKKRRREKENKSPNPCTCKRFLIFSASKEDESNKRPVKTTWVKMKLCVFHILQNSRGMKMRASSLSSNMPRRSKLCLSQEPNKLLLNNQVLV